MLADNKYPMRGTVDEQDEQYAQCVELPKFAFLLHLRGQATYRSLITAIADAIDGGLLTAGDRMPSSRELALYAKTSRTTVTRAFDRLVARGYLVAINGSGTVVAHTRLARTQSTVTPTKQPNFEWEKRFSLVAEHLLERRQDSTTAVTPNQRSLARAQDERSLAGPRDEQSSGATRDERSFPSARDERTWAGVPAGLLPLRDWRKVILAHSHAAATEEADSPLLFTPDRKPEERRSCEHSFGYRPLREAVADFLRRTRGILCDPDQIVLYAGPQSGLAHMAQLLFKAGDRAICEEPGHRAAREQFRIHGVRVSTAPVDREGIMVEELALIERPAQWLYITPSCQDPTGAVLSQERARELLDWCRRKGTAVIEDAWDSDFHFSPSAVPSLYSLDERRAVLYLYSFCRLLFPLTSTSVLVLPEKLVPLFRKSKDLSDRQYPLVEHHALTELIASGVLEEHARSVWKSLRKRRQSMVFALNASFGEQVRVLSPGAGLNIVAKFGDRFSARDIEINADLAGLPISPSSSRLVGRAQSSQHLINFSNIKEEEAMPIVERFAAGLSAGHQRSSIFAFGSTATLAAPEADRRSGPGV